MKHTLKTQVGILVVFSFCILGAFALDVKADEPCKTPEALAHLANVRENQPRIAENRDAAKRVKDAVANGETINPDDVPGYNIFTLNKGYNESENDALHALGCQVDWQTLELVPFKPGATVTHEMHAAADYDLDKLAKAVAMHETKDCGVNVGSALVNNCFGIRGWRKDGTPYFKQYATKEDSYKDFKRIWSTYYGRFPDTALAKKYSGNDRPQQWLANVTHFYEAL